MKNKKNCLIFFVTIIIIAAAVVTGIIMYNNSDATRLKKQLDLGQKYLAEMNYEEAVVAFNQAIEIDPRSADAYFGLADAYLGLGDEEAALAALEAGYEATGDGRLKERIDEMEAAIEREREAAEAAEENARIAKRVEEISDFISSETPIHEHDTRAENHLLTYGQIEAFCRPLAEELEMYLEQGEGDWEYTAWHDLALLYCHMSEMDKCLETRRRGYEATGDESLNPEQPYEWAENRIDDEYGRSIDNTWVYEEGDRLTTWDSTTSSGYPSHFEFEYDDLGRISRIHSSVTNPDYGEFLYEYIYEYLGNNSVTVTNDAGSFTETYTLTYNEYGEVVDRTETVHVSKR